MDLKDRVPVDTWAKASSSISELSRKSSLEDSSFTSFRLQQHQQKWEDTPSVGYGIRVEPPFQDFNPPPETQVVLQFSNNQIKIPAGGDASVSETLQSNKIQHWDPRTVLHNLSFLEQKIHQLQDLVHVIGGHGDQVLGRRDDFVAQQQQLITADLTSIIVQLISTAGSLLPSVKHTLPTATSPIGQFGGILVPSVSDVNGGMQHQQDGESKAVQPQQCSGTKVFDCSNQMDITTGKVGTEPNHSIEEHELKDEEDADEGENLPPGSYDILQLEKEEILAPHTHFCMICGKGFKRDANLRMHMRGHGDEYKTPAALAKPHKESSSEPVPIKRYSCPFAGCKRNKDHKKFLPLKTILCVKNHYKRTHCDKRYICSRCNTKKFSVIADLKTHEKHCGKDKWLCSCGTTFSRKDKLFGHIALFQGHTPAIPLDESKAPAGSSDNCGDPEAANKSGNISFNFGSSAASVNATRNANIVDVKGGADDPVSSYFSPLNFDACNFSGFPEFIQPPFDDSESSFTFLISGSCNYSLKTGEDSSSGNL